MLAWPLWFAVCSLSPLCRPTFMCCKSRAPRSIHWIQQRTLCPWTGSTWPCIRISRHWQIRRLSSGPVLAELRPCFGPWSPHIAPALRISLSRPLILTRHNLATTLELSLKNLLYADIKLSKLVQEYKQLRDRSRELISSHPKVEQSEGSGSIQERKRILMDWKQQETRRIIALMESSQALADIDQDVLQDLRSMAEKELRIRPLKVRKKESQSSSSASSEAASTGQSLTKGQDRGLSIDPYPLDSRLPWLFQDILFLVTLVWKYKIETALIGMSLVLMGAALGKARVK